ncbi:dipeptidase [Bacteroidota bacterium]
MKQQKHRNTIIQLYFIVIIIFSNSCTPTLTSYSDEELKKKANDLAHNIIIIDTHIDLPLRLEHKWFDVTERSDGRQMDYVRATEGGLDAPFMSIYIPPRFQGTPKAKASADTLIFIVEKLIKEHPDKLAKAFTPEDIEKNFKKGLISLPMGMENGAPIENLKLLKYYHQKGIRYVTLAHGKWNHICDSSYDEERNWDGLSPFGKELIKEMNRIGMIIDVSHITDEAFYQVMELSKVPVIASHSSCRHYTPGWERNMNDDMIKLLAKNGGVIQLNFGSEFLDQGRREREEKYQEHVRSFIKKNELERNDPKVEEFKNKYKRENPIGYADISKLVEHIDHVVEIAGIDYVGLGSDFEGLGDQLPTGLKDVSMYPNLIFELLKRGYSEEEIAKICSGNTLRVWNAVVEYSEKFKD